MLVALYLLDRLKSTMSSAPKSRATINKHGGKQKAHRAQVNKSTKKHTKDRASTVLAQRLKGMIVYIFIYIEFFEVIQRRGIIAFPRDLLFLINGD